MAKMWFSFATYLLERVGGVEIILSGDPTIRRGAIDFLSRAPLGTVLLLSPILVFIAHNFPYAHS